MSMTKVRFLRTTTAAGCRHAKDDEVSVDEMIARDLVATGKAENVPEQAEPARDDKRPLTSAKAKRGD